MNQGDNMNDDKQTRKKASSQARAQAESTQEEQSQTSQLQESQASQDISSLKSPNNPSSHTSAESNSTLWHTLCAYICALYTRIKAFGQTSLQKSYNEAKENYKEEFTSERPRYLTALLLILGIVVILAWNHAIVVWAVVGIAFLLGFKEALALYDIRANLWLYALAIATWILAFFHTRPLETALIASLIMASVIAYKHTISTKTMLPFLYPAIPFFMLYSVYVDFGVWRIVWLIVVVSLCDIGAYLGGKIFGKTAFAPVSPRKTLEGVVIGVVLASVVGGVAGVFMLNTHFVLALVFSIVVAVCGVCGDLFESYLKRRAEVKDSGTMLPGHGGILDRFDAVLFGAVGMHICLMFVSEFSCATCAVLGADLL